MSDRKFYKPPKRSTFMMYFGGAAFAIGVILLWIFAEKFGIEVKDLLMLTGFALIILSAGLLNKNTEKKVKQQERDLEKMREECGKNDYNNDIFFD